MKRVMMATLFFVVAMTAPSQASEIEIRLSPDATTIEFELKATLHTVHGTARLSRGSFTFDTATGAATGEAIVAAASADTDNDKRDRKMHDKVLLTSDHPEISVRAEQLEGLLRLEGESDVTLVGTMVLLGAPHPIRIPMKVRIDGDTATVDATFSVPYVEWGLEDPSTFVLRVGKEVPVTIHASDVSVNPFPARQDDASAK